MSDCTHTGKKKFIHRAFPDGSRRFAWQCQDCGKSIKYNGKVWLGAKDIPAGATIYPFIWKEAS